MSASNIPMPDPWRAAKSELTDWTMAHLVNRFDARGGYYSRNGETRRTTRKNSDKGWRPHNIALLLHFAATLPIHIIGLHSTSPENTSRWLAIDIDAHRGEDPIDNLRIAIEIGRRLGEFGLTAHLLNSDGRGGIHIFVIFDKPIAATLVFALGQRVSNGFAVETYPRQPKIALGGYGNWLRLPGRHHTRDHWTRYWSGESWLDAKGTVNAILAIEPGVFPELPPLVRVERVPVRRGIKNRLRSSFTKSPDSLRTWLECHGITVKETRSSSNDTAILVLGRCPFFDDHGEGDGDTSVAVTWRPTGVGFRCFHNRCAHFGWKDLREKIAPTRVNRHSQTKRRWKIGATKLCAGPKLAHAKDMRTYFVRCEKLLRSQS